jgi:hypothetical protein
VPADTEAAFAAAMADVPWAFVGEVHAEPRLDLIGTAGTVERVDLARLDAAWRSLARENC